MSKQIERLMKKRPDVFYDVSYEGEDGTWLYMQPGWYCVMSDTGTIHEHTIAEVLSCAKSVYFDEARWRRDNPSYYDQPLPVYKPYQPIRMEDMLKPTPMEELERN